MNIRLHYDAMCSFVQVSSVIMLYSPQLSLNKSVPLSSQTMVHETIYYCAINVYGVLMSFVLNKHITIFTDNDMYHANVATLGNRSPILNEHIDTSLIVRVLKYDVFNCLANQRSFIFRVTYCVRTLYNISDKSC